MPLVSTHSQRAQSPDVLLDNTIDKNIDKDILAHETLSYEIDSVNWKPVEAESGESEAVKDLKRKAEAVSARVERALKRQMQSLAEQDAEVAEAEQKERETDSHDQNIPVISNQTIPENEHTLATRYAAMLDNRNETEIFDLHNTVNTDQYATELRQVLTDAFSLHAGVTGDFVPDYDFKDTTQLIQQIAYNSNYSVENVTRVMNKQHYKMHRSFAETYNIEASRTVYHGTSQAGAKCIQAVGFKASAGRRAKFGKGIYTSPVVWQAIGYAKPYHDARQVLFVVEMLQGPTALGHEDQHDFGVDAMGSEILTFKNIEETVLCVSKENQLLATYRITVRYMFENPFILRHRECVRIVHPDIDHLIKHSRLEAYSNKNMLFRADPKLPSNSAPTPTSKRHRDCPRHRKYNPTAMAPWRGGEVKPFLYGRKITFILSGKRGDPIAR